MIFMFMIILYVCELVPTSIRGMIIYLLLVFELSSNMIGLLCFKNLRDSLEMYTTTA